MDWQATFGKQACDVSPASILGLSSPAARGLVFVSNLLLFNDASTQSATYRQLVLIGINYVGSKYELAAVGASTM